MIGHDYTRDFMERDEKQLLFDQQRYAEPKGEHWYLCGCGAKCDSVPCERCRMIAELLERPWTNSPSAMMTHSHPERFWVMNIGAQDIGIIASAHGATQAECDAITTMLVMLKQVYREASEMIRRHDAQGEQGGHGACDCYECERFRPLLAKITGA